MGIGFKAIRMFVIGTAAIATVVSECFHKENIKIEDRIVADTFQKEEPKNILVLDSYQEQQIPIDLGFVPDVPHGYVTSKIIENALPNYNVYKHNVPLKNEFYEQSKVKHAILGNILDDIKSGKKYDAINISLGVLMPFDELNKQTNLNITKENLKSTSRELKDYLIKNSDKSLYNGTSDSVKAGALMNFIDDLDSISAKGAKIYISAGNEGKDYLNLLSLVDNSITVGALSSNGEKASYSCDNSLVSDWENGNLPVKKTKDGFNFTGGEQTDLEDKYTSNYFKIPGFDIDGTSFAAPRVLVNDFKKNQTKQQLEY